MQPALTVAGLWLLFGGMHIGLASRPVRDRLVGRLGEGGHAVAFSLVASATFLLLVGYYAAHRGEGAPGLGLGGAAVLGWMLRGTIGVGFMLIAGSLAAYGRTPYAIAQGQGPTPRGLERITRHGFFAGTTLVALAHVLLATRLVGTAFIAGFAVLAIVGAWHQDHKLLRLRGRPFADYLAVTSALPFGAILAGRQQLAWRELPGAALLVGLATAVALRSVHGGIFAHGGLWFSGSVIVPAWLLLAWFLWMTRRSPGRLTSQRTVS